MHVTYQIKKFILKYCTSKISAFIPQSCFMLPFLNVFFNICIVGSASVLCPFYCFILYAFVYM